MPLVFVPLRPGSWSGGKCFVFAWKWFLGMGEVVREVVPWYGRKWCFGLVERIV